MNNISEDFKDRPRIATNGLFDRSDKSIDELLLGHYPDLNQKELIVCHMVITSLWDNGDTYYDAVVLSKKTDNKVQEESSRTLENNLKNNSQGQPDLPSHTSQRSQSNY